MSRGPYARISTELKERLVASWEDGGDILEAASVLNIKPSTARSIILRYQSGETLDDKCGGRREETVKLTEDVISRIIDIIERHPDFTLRQVKEELGETLSVTSISRGLDCRLITMKKLEDCPAQRNSPRVKEARSTYAQWYLEGGLNKTLIYVDETSFNVFTKRTRGRAVRGRPAVRQIGGQRGPNLNLVMAVASGAGVVYYELQRGTMTGQ